VSQRTRVIVVPPAQRAELAQKLRAGDFEQRSVPHAAVSVKGDGVVATLYTSDKLVIQGADPDLFAARWVGAEPESAAAAPGRAGRAAFEPAVGSDETGKGDYFGPLVVVAVRLEPDQAQELVAAGVTDSKRLSDERALRLGAALRGRYEHAVARLDPPEYNAVYARGAKLNAILADLHVEAIRGVARPGDDVLVDQFADARLLAGKLAGLDVTLHQRPRAEEVPVVAAASVIARELFLVALRELSDEAAIDLHKGAGAPVDKVGRELVKLHGAQGLGRFAKLHFKNTQRVLPGRSGAR
jgi:ribonuclease HIII